MAPGNRAHPGKNAGPFMTVGAVGAELQRRPEKIRVPAPSRRFFRRSPLAPGREADYTPGPALEGWPSGRRRTPGKCVYLKRVSWVRIPHPPPVSPSRKPLNWNGPPRADGPGPRRPGRGMAPSRASVLPAPAEHRPWAAPRGPPPRFPTQPAPTVGHGRKRLRRVRALAVAKVAAPVTVKAEGASAAQRETAARPSRPPRRGPSAPRTDWCGAGTPV